MGVLVGAHNAEIALTEEQARLIWELAVLTEDRTLEEEAALTALAEQLDAAGQTLVDHDGHLLPLDLSGATTETWKPQELDL